MEKGASEGGIDRVEMQLRPGHGTKRRLLDVVKHIPERADEHNLTAEERAVFVTGSVHCFASKMSHSDRGANVPPGPAKRIRCGSSGRGTTPP